MPGQELINLFLSRVVSNALVHRRLYQGRPPGWLAAACSIQAKHPSDGNWVLDRGLTLELLGCDRHRGYERGDSRHWGCAGSITWPVELVELVLRNFAVFVERCLVPLLGAGQGPGSGRREPLTATPCGDPRRPCRTGTALLVPSRANPVSPCWRKRVGGAASSGYGFGASRRSPGNS